MGLGLQYLKHMAYKSGMMGWRTLVSNHRGLGGVSITVSNHFSHDVPMKIMMLEPPVGPMHLGLGTMI